MFSLLAESRLHFRSALESARILSFSCDIQLRRFSFESFGIFWFCFRASKKLHFSTGLSQWKLSNDATSLCAASPLSTEPCFWLSSLSPKSKAIYKEIYDINLSSSIKSACGKISVFRLSISSLENLDNTQSLTLYFLSCQTQIFILWNASDQRLLIRDLIQLCHHALHSGLYLNFPKPMLISSKITIISILKSNL